MATAALETWAAPALQRSAGARVRFVSVASTAGTPLEPFTLHVPGDEEVDYRHLPIRILKIWHYLGQHEPDECDWIFKADSDTYVNLRTLSDRLSCFRSEDPHYLGVVHALVPPRHLRDMWAALYFGHGGSGYGVSRGALADVGAASPVCLEDMMHMTQGDAMEDVIFALCLKRQLGLQVSSYGFLLPSSAGNMDFDTQVLKQEFIVNFHQARDELLAQVEAPGQPLQRFIYWDAQPPPLHGCLIIAHPVENETDLHKVHAAVLQDTQLQVAHLAQVPRLPPPRLLVGERPGRAQCAPSAASLARQAEVRLSAPNTEAKAFWTSDQLGNLSSCLAAALGPAPRCEWSSTSAQFYGLSHWPPARSVDECVEACCRSGAECSLFQYQVDQGCWLGRWEEAQPVVSELTFIGGVKMA